VGRNVSRRKEQENRARHSDRATQRKRKRVSQELREFEGEQLVDLLERVDAENDEDAFETFEPHLRRVRWN